MATPRLQAPAIRRIDHSAARAAAALPAAAALLVGVSLALPHPPGGDESTMIVIAAGMLAAAIGCYAAADSIPISGTHLIIALTVACTGWLVVESGVAAGQFGSVFVWSTLVTAYFFPRRLASIHLLWVLVVYGTALAIVPSTAGVSPVAKLLVTALSLTVVMALTSEIVKRRRRADARARHFFDLAQDMLCTMDTSGRCIEANETWEEQLGYSTRELEGKSLLELTHPEDQAHAVEEARKLFAGEPVRELETRVRANDGSWHWLRTSYAFADSEGLVYARSTDVTELKSVEAEREKLLAEVQSLARSDALTGLPNRRTLEEVMPRELAHARRVDTSLCLALLDIDHFKAYNDTHGHQAGDTLLRKCAMAWDDQLRGEDTIVRFGGEEFIVVLPETSPEQGLEILERLRAAVPSEQTCSAGLAVWDTTETEAELIERADEALYEAKASGRDRTVEAKAPVA